MSNPEKSILLELIENMGKLADIVEHVMDNMEHGRRDDYLAMQHVKSILRKLKKQILRL